MIELLVVIAIVSLLMGILLPAIGKAKDTAKVSKSMSNLKNFGVAHQTYASEWNGRQWTTMPDDLTVIQNFNNNYPVEYPTSGPLSVVPSVPLGFDENGNYFEVRRSWAILPLWYPENCSLGNFRAFHTRPFNQYLNGKVYDRIFWAPKDYTIEEDIFQYWANPGQWPGAGTTFYFSTYCMSVAAQVNPEVYRRAENNNGNGPVAATQLAAGHKTPNFGQARYPDLKTHMLEHYWLQQNPSEYIPGTNVPWFYNMGADSTPATLFYDGHIRMMSVREAVQSSQRNFAQAGFHLDSTDVKCFGPNGYFEGYAYGGDASRINSYHVFTTDGILGRDTFGQQ